MDKTKLNFITFVLHPGWIYSINDGDWHYITFSMLNRLHHLKPNFICFDVNKMLGVDCGNFVNLYPHATPTMYEWISLCIYRDWWDAFDWSFRHWPVQLPDYLEYSQKDRWFIYKRLGELKSEKSKNIWFKIHGRREPTPPIFSDQTLDFLKAIVEK